MTGAPMTDVTTLFREAFFRYNSANPLQPKACVRFATRSMMLLADYCRQHGLHAEAHSALTRAQAQVSVQTQCLRCHIHRVLSSDLRCVC